MEESEVVGMQEVGMTGGTQLSVMEVDDGEDEIVVLGEVKQGETHKWAPLLPPKMLRKRVCMVMVIQMPVGSQAKGGLVQESQVGSGSVGSIGTPCERCIKH